MSLNRHSILENSFSLKHKGGKNALRVLKVVAYHNFDVPVGLEEFSPHRTVRIDPALLKAAQEYKVIQL